MKNIKKIIAGILLLSVILNFTSCNGREEYFNDKDRTDFITGDVIRFDVIQLENVVDKTTLEKNNLSGGFFLFMGAVTSTSTKQTSVTNVYYGYVKNQSGGIYFLEMPANKVRIYEDSETFVIVANMSRYAENYEENEWDDYTMFNLHVPPNTIIPRVDTNIGLDGLSN